MSPFPVVRKRLVVTALEGQHDRVGVLAVEFLAAGDIAFERAG